MEIWRIIYSVNIRNTVFIDLYICDKKVMLVVIVCRVDYVRQCPPLLPPTHAMASEYDGTSDCNGSCCLRPKSRRYSAIDATLLC